MKQRAEWLRQPKVVVPVLLAGGLLAAAISLSDMPRVFQDITRIPALSLLSILALAALYLTLKGLQFHFLLTDLNISVGWRSMLVAYAVGELVLTLPLGIYAQNYLLRRLQSVDVYRSAAVTTLMLVFEAGILFGVLAFLGLQGWPWVRPLALVCLVGLIVVVVGIARWRGLRRHAAGIARRLKLPGRAPVSFLSGLDSLAQRRIALRRGYLTLLYLCALIVAFRIVGHGVGVTRLGVFQAASIYAFSLSTALVFGGVTSQIGVLELAGMGAAQACGYGYTQGLAMLLGFRLVWTASIWLLGLPVVYLLRGELSDSSIDGGKEPTD